MSPVRAVAPVVVAVVAVLLGATSCRMPTPAPGSGTGSPPQRTPSAAGPSGSGEPERFTPLIIRSLAPNPVPVPGSDGKVHVGYELEVLNAAPRPATLTTVETLAGGPDGAVVSTLRGAEIVASSILVADYALPPVPATSVPPGRTVLLILDAMFSSRAAVPDTLSHRISATYGTFEPNQGDFAQNNFPARSVEQGGELRIGSGEPIVIRPPLRGDSWVAVNGCCGLSPHRGAMLPVGGRINGAERYAIDWAKFDLRARPIVDLSAGTQATFVGDPKRNESYFTFGQPVQAVADGSVVSVVENLPEAPPREFLSLPLADLGGNRVVIEHADGVHSFYAHLETDSVSVRPGETVRAGQQIAAAGNSGNTSESHLHFHLMDGPDPLTAVNIPWVLDGFTFEGDVNPEAVDTARAGPRENEFPLMYSAARFPE
jgi:hypothetical protein